MTLRLTKNSALSKKPFVVITQRPSASLRIAFWGLITSSGICWTLALLLGSSLLSSCSGSIFSSEGKGNPPANIAPAVGGEEDPDRGLAPPSPDFDPNDPNYSIVKRSDRSGRVVTDVDSLNIFKILAPAQILEWTQGMSDNQENDFLSKLSLYIVMGSASRSGKDDTVRKISFYISRDGYNVSSNPDPKAPYISMSGLITTDEVIEGYRMLYGTGWLNEKDDGTKQFIALSLKLKHNSKTSYTLAEGSRFVEYSDAGTTLEPYSLSNNTLFKFSLKD